MTSPLSLTDAVRAAIQNQLNVIHTAFPGIVISYDYTMQKASIQPALNKRYTTVTPLQPQGIVEPMPILANVPIVFPRSGGASLNFPVLPGDTVLVICSERSLDTWLNQGGQVTPNDPRKFDLSDGMAIAGLYPFSSPSPALNNTDVTLQYAGSIITITATGAVKINTASTVAIGNSVTEVLSVISSFLGDMISAIYAPPAGTLDPATAAKLLALQVKINAITGTLP